MRFLLVNRFFGPKSSPTGRMLWDVASILIERGHKVTVLTSNGCYDSGAALAARQQTNILRLEVTSFGRTRVLNWAWFWLCALLSVPIMSWDRCVILTDPPFMLVAGWLARFFNRKRGAIFWWTMDLYPEALRAAGLLDGSQRAFRLLWGLNELGLSATTGVIALSASQRRLLSRYKNWKDGEAFHIVVPPWNSQRITEVPSSRNALIHRFGWDSRKVALYAGNLGRGHSFYEILEGAKWLHAHDRSDWVFVFATRGAQESQLRERSRTLPNVRVMNYVEESETSALLCAATVHLVTMGPGWEGIIVPSKTCSSLQTRSPLLYIGPLESDTAQEVSRLNRGLALPAGTSGSSVAKALDELCRPAWLREPHQDSSSPDRIVNFITREEL